MTSGFVMLALEAIGVVTLIAVALAVGNIVSIALEIVRSHK
jgi:hypothetical protein